MFIPEGADDREHHLLSQVAGRLGVARSGENQDPDPVAEQADEFLLGRRFPGADALSEAALNSGVRSPRAVRPLFRRTEGSTQVSRGMPRAPDSTPGVSFVRASPAAGPTVSSSLRFASRSAIANHVPNKDSTSPSGGCNDFQRLPELGQVVGPLTQGANMTRQYLSVTAFVVATTLTQHPVTAAKPGAGSPTIVDLGTLGGAFSDAFGINNDPDNIQVVGYSTRADGFSHGFFWTAATKMIDLGSLGRSSDAATSTITA